MKTFNEILPSFLANIKIRIKEATYRSYVGKSNVFNEWLTLHGFSHTPLAGINDQIIEQFSVYLANERKLDRPTCLKYKGCLYSIFKYSMMRGEIQTIPLDLFVLPRKGVDCGAQVIPQQDFKVLLDDIKVKDKQLYLILMSEYYAGIRPTELRLLKTDELDFNTGTITILGERAKTGRRRIVTMPSQLQQLFVDQNIDKAGKGLYVFGKGKKPDTMPCSVNMFGYRFRKFRNKHNFSKSYKLYSSKHNGITSLHNMNVPIGTIMEHIGHVNINSTQHYIHKHTEIGRAHV
jgi:integrase